MWIYVNDKLPEWDNKVEVLCVDESRNVYIGPAYCKMYGSKREWLDTLMIPFSERGITVKYWRQK